MYELHVHRADGSAFVWPVPPSGGQIGRVPGNDLVMNDHMVSRHHVLVYVQDTELWMRDLGSRNGTFVNGERVVGSVRVYPGDTVSLGPDANLRVVRSTGLAEPTPCLLVEDVASGVCVPIASDRFYIGSGKSSDLVRADLPERLAVLLVHDNGEVWLGAPEQEHEVAVDAPFQVGGHAFVLRRGDVLHGVTAVPQVDRYPYTLKARLDGPTGPEATIVDPRTGLTWNVEAENRAVLLYLLARQHEQDAAAGLPARERGWCMDEDVQRGIWGEDLAPENRLNVLVYRLRGELGRAGIDPWFIEKRRKAIRARVQLASVA